MPCRVLALDGGALSFVELMFHTANAPRMPGRPDAAAMQDAAWQAAYERRGWAVTALDPSAAVIDHVALITSPPDGRYSPLGAPPATAPKLLRQPQRHLTESEEGSGSGAAQAEQEEQGWVRALVFSLDPPAAEQPAEQVEVQLSGWLPNGIQLFSKPMQLLGGTGSSNGSSDGGLLFAAQGETTVSCVGAAGNPAAHCHAPADLVSIQASAKCWESGAGVATYPCWRVMAGVAWPGVSGAAWNASQATSCKPGCGCCHPNCWFQNTTWLALSLDPAGQRQGPQRCCEPLAAAASRAALHRTDRLPSALLGGPCARAAAAPPGHRAGVGWPGLQLACDGAQVCGLAWPPTQPRCKLRIEASARSQLKRQGR